MTKTQAQTNSESDSSFCAERLKVLANPTRLSIMRELMQGSQEVKELNEEIKIDQSLLSHHLQVLRESGLVVSERKGKGVLYGLAPAIKSASDKNKIQLGCCVLSFE